MPQDEQKRIANAYMKMRENIDGPGTSIYFKMAVIHGGMRNFPRSKYPEFCAHRRECFPCWHRPYMNEFERMLRRADIALGGDGNIGLPYWDWSQTTVNGEVLPGMVRKWLMVEFEDDFFPPGADEAHFSLARTKPDSTIGPSIERGGVAEMAAQCLNSATFKMMASTKDGNHREPSLESPHNSIHGICGGVMASFQSSFQPVFWMHHCNVDRIYQKYIEIHPDSKEEFKKNQNHLTRTGQTNPSPGFPEGPYGPYEPFIDPTTGKTYEAAAAFEPTQKYGFEYDKLPPLRPPQMREMPWVAEFKAIDIRKVKTCKMLYVFVALKGTTPTMCGEPVGSLTTDMLVRAENFAGFGTIFFLDTPNECENCKQNPVINLNIDVTPTLRKLNLNPKKVELFTIVEESADGTFSRIVDTAVPIPTLKGPSFAEPDKDDDEDEEEVITLQKLLALEGKPGVASGKRCDATVAAIKKYQAEIGLPETGKADKATKRSLTMAGLRGDDETDGGIAAKPGDKVTWTVDLDSIPGGFKDDDVVGELAAAFKAWSEPTQLEFEYVAGSYGAAMVTVEFADHSEGNHFKFDGPGGALARAFLADDKGKGTISFDVSERWELYACGKKNPMKEWVSWDQQYFELLPVALHEIGHILGLTHSPLPADVMAPYYVAGRVELTANDKVRVGDLLGVASA